jgi:hypothetical protein
LDLRHVVLLPSISGTTGKKIARGRSTYAIFYDVALDMFASVSVKDAELNPVKRSSAGPTMTFKCGL